MWGRSRPAPLPKTTVPAPSAVSWGSLGTPAAPCSVRPRVTPVLGGRRGPRRGAGLPGDGLGELDSRPSLPSPWLGSWPLTARVITGFCCGGGRLRWSLCECGGAPGALRVWAPGALRHQPGALANPALPPPLQPPQRMPPPPGHVAQLALCWVRRHTARQPGRLAEAWPRLLSSLPGSVENQSSGVPTRRPTGRPAFAQPDCRWASSFQVMNPAFNLLPL